MIDVGLFILSDSSLELPYYGSSNEGQPYALMVKGQKLISKFRALDKREYLMIIFLNSHQNRKS